MPASVFGCYNSGPGNIAGMEGVENGEAAERPTVYNAVSPSPRENYPALNGQEAEVEKPCSNA